MHYAKDGRGLKGQGGAAPDGRADKTRAERLADRLRDNLRRRKLQARGRRAAPDEGNVPGGGGDRES